MKYTVYLFDNSYGVIDEKHYENGIADIENAMFNKTPVYLGKAMVAGASISKIEPFGNKEYGQHDSQQLASGLERAALMLDEGRAKNPSNRDKIRQEIRDRFKKLGAVDDDKRQYVANLELAKKLHGEELEAL
jgi:hypothetical protein